jgi:hypothetical protein
MTIEYSSAQLMGFAKRGMLDKAEMADLLPGEPRSAFLAACAEVEREFTHDCAANGEACLPAGCALEGEACLNALLKDGPAYNKACGALWLPLFRSSTHVA